MIVTSIDREFFPGLVALRNSILAHSPGVPIACYTYGDDELAKSVSSLGIEVVHNASISDYLPPGDNTESGCQPMYARLLAPGDFGDCVWMDADQVVRGDISPLLEMRFDQAVAAVPAERQIGETVSGISTKHGRSFYSGLMRFNAETWKRREVTRECISLMSRRDVYWRFVVQSVLAVVIAGAFKHLDKKWQGFANRPETRIDNFTVLHWHGRTLKPWTHPEMPHADVWRKYFCMF